MNIETKFNFNDKVFNISFSNETEWIPCGFCDGHGVIDGFDDTTRTCPVCYGNRGKNKTISKIWKPDIELTIGEVRVETKCKYKPDYDSYFDNYGEQDENYSERYMCYETGIGSGTLWPVKDLFITLEEAQKECDKRNKS